MNHTFRRRNALTLVTLLAAALTLAACSGEPEAAPTPQQTIKVSIAPATPTPTPTPTPTIEPAGVIATVTGAAIVAFDAPDGAEVATFENPIASGAPLVFLVEEEAGAWLKVQLPMRPNGATGWIAASEVTLENARYSLEVSTADHSVTLLRDGEIEKVFDAAIGTGDTPTPTGNFFITELLQPTNWGYGDYAYGISAFSEVLNSFGGGPGQIGIHGTEDEDSIGTAASHGCVRLKNEDISYLAAILPLGTPVHIS